MKLKQLVTLPYNSNEIIYIPARSYSKKNQHVHIAKRTYEREILRTVAHKIALFTDVCLPPRSIGRHVVFTGDGMNSRETEVARRDSFPKMASAEATAEPERGMTIFLDVG